LPRPRFTASACFLTVSIRPVQVNDHGALEELRHLSALTVEAIVLGKPPILSYIKSVSHIEVLSRPRCLHP
jgi:hypothetical protein